MIYSERSVVRRQLGAFSVGQIALCSALQVGARLCVAYESRRRTCWQARSLCTPRLLHTYLVVEPNHSLALSVASLGPDRPRSPRCGSADSRSSDPHPSVLPYKSAHRLSLTTAPPVAYRSGAAAARCRSL